MNARGLLRLPRLLFAVLFVTVALVAPSRYANATTIERVVSPGGIVAWLVRQPTVPLIAINFAFRGGASQDPAAKPGVASLVASLMDEGAGEIDSQHYHEQIEANAIEFSFAATRDYMAGSLRVLTDNQDAALELLHLSLTAPRFEGPDVERMRDQILSGLRRATQTPNDIASRQWWAKAFPDHPYGRPPGGTLDSVPTIDVGDLRTFVRNVFARDNLEIGIVGNIDAAGVGALVDRVFGSLPAKSTLTSIPYATPRGLGDKLVIDLDVPQSVLMIGGNGIPRKDPDFMAAFVLNHVLGGGTFTSRLYKEVREVRGLAYSVYSAVMPLNDASLFIAGTATRADRTNETLDVMESEIRKLADTGPTQEELDGAKSFLRGSYALRFDTSTKIAEQLTAIQLEDLGIDYIDKRNDMVAAVTIEDVKRVARRLLDAKMLVTVVGKPQPTPAKGGG